MPGCARLEERTAQHQKGGKPKKGGSGRATDKRLPISNEALWRPIRAREAIKIGQNGKLRNWVEPPVISILGAEEKSRRQAGVALVRGIPFTHSALSRNVWQLR